MVIAASLSLTMVLLLVLTLVGYGLARLLVPRALWSERLTLAPLLGVVLVVVVQDLGGFFWPATRVSWLILGIAAALALLSHRLRREKYERPALGGLLLCLPLTLLALIPLWQQGQLTLVQLTNHDAFYYWVMERQLALHPAAALPLPPANVIDRLYLKVASELWRLGVVNLSTTLNTIGGQSFLHTFNCQLAIFAGLSLPAVRLGLRLWDQGLSSTQASLGALLLGLPLFAPLLVAEAYASQLLSLPLQLGALGAFAAMLRERDRRSVVLAALPLGAALSVYPETLPLIVLPMLAAGLHALRQRQANRLFCFVLLTALFAPISILRAAAFVARIEQLDAGTWPAHTSLQLARILLGLDADPGLPSVSTAARLLGLSLGVLVVGWLVIKALTSEKSSPGRTLLSATLLVAVPAPFLLQQLLSHPGYPAAKLALSAGPLLLFCAGLGATRVLQARHPTGPRLFGVAAALLTLVVLPAHGALARRLATPHVVIDDELLALRRQLERLPARGSLIVENGSGPRALVIDHYASLFFVADTFQPMRRAFPSPDGRSYLSLVAQPRAARDGPRPWYLIQPRLAWHFSTGLELFSGPTLSLIAARRDRPTGTFASEGLEPPEGEPGRVVRWATGPATIILRSFSARGCFRLRFELRSVRGSRRVTLRWAGQPHTRSITVGERWVPWQSGARHWNGPDERLRLAADGPAIRPPEDRRWLRFAVANAEVRPCRR